MDIAPPGFVICPYTRILGTINVDTWYCLAQVKEVLRLTYRSIQDTSLA